MPIGSSQQAVAKTLDNGPFTPPFPDVNSRETGDDLLVKSLPDLKLEDVKASLKASQTLQPGGAWEGDTKGEGSEWEARGYEWDGGWVSVCVKL